MNAPTTGLLVMLCGAPGSGKSTWARRHFTEQEIVSSDALRAWVCGDPNNQQATPDAVALMHLVVGARLRFGQLTVVDATNGDAQHREVLLQLARAAECPAIAVILDVPQAECERRNQLRSGTRRVPERFLRATHAKVDQFLAGAGSRPPTGFCAALIVGPDGAAHIVGQVPAGHAGAEWLITATRPASAR